MFSKSIKHVSVAEFNKAIVFCSKYRNILKRGLEKGERVQYKAFLEEADVEVRLTYKQNDQRNITIVARKDGIIGIDTANGLLAYRVLSQYTKVPHAKFPTKDGRQPTIAGLLYTNEKYDNTRTSDCVAYDINSSYTWAMCQDMPDTSVAPDTLRKLKENEIGFDTNFNIITSKDKRIALYIYPKIKSPFIKFCNTWYDKKKNAKNRAEKQYAKDILNKSVGYLQRINPVIRAAILSYANQRIEKLIDNNTLYCNTDSIISKVRRPEIEKNIGTELGQWKVEHSGAFALKGCTYQWNHDVPTYRGIPKSRFKENWDLLLDETPEANYKYKLDTNTYKLVNNEGN